MQALTYDKVYLIPKFSDLKSRLLADTSVEFLGKRFSVPWLPANMSSVINFEISKFCSENDFYYVMHRFGDNKEFIKKSNLENWKNISISVGVKSEDYDLVNWIRLNNYRVDFITIDVAHGHHILVKDMISHIKNTIPTIRVVAGNICTLEALSDLSNWGADGAKIGLSMGKACTTYNTTGVGSPMFSTLKELHNKNIKIQIIADGGVREFGDISKALSVGADMVMIGSMISACVDSPALNVRKYIKTGYCNHRGEDEIESVLMKEYYGSASQYQKKSGTFIEGQKILLKCNNLTVEQFYKKGIEAMQSSISYCGGTLIKDLRNFIHKS